ncbi:MAG: prolyl oligopeptidase family serine peptidase [Verrucomicrobiota bacterium]
MRLLLCLICFFPLIETVPADGSKQAYERADDLGRRTSGKVFRDRVEPRWIGESSRFWYRVRTGPDQYEFMVVDPDQGTRETAFDHAALATLLTGELGKSIDARELPFREIEPGEQGIDFTAGDRRFRVDPSGGLSELDRPAKKGNASGVVVLPEVREDRSRGAETGISFENKTGGEIEIFWAADQGSLRSYQKLQPGQRHDQHTYAGHVWVIKNAEDTTIGVYAATGRPGLVVVDGSWKPGKPKKKKSEKRRPASPRSGSSTSPDGHWKARIEGYNVVLETGEGESVQLTSAGSEEDPFEPPFHWSPDSRKLVVLQKKKVDRRQVHLVESSPKDQRQPKWQSFDYVKPGDELDHPRPRLFDLAARSEIPVAEDLFPQPWRLSDFSWRSDSNAFRFVYNERGHQVYRLVSIDAGSGAASSLVEEVPETFVCYSSKTYYRYLEATDEIIWMSERDGWNHLYLFDGSSGALKNRITGGDWVVRKVERIDVGKRQVWFQAGGLFPEQDPYHIHHCRVGFDGGDPVRLTEGDGTHQITYSPDGRYLVDTWSRVDHPPVTELRRAADGSLVRILETADASALEATGWRPPERFVAPGRDGKTPIYGVIHRPTRFDPAKKYPVIEKIYAGPHSAHVPKRFSSRGASMAELGFIVVQIDGMGTSHRSKAFHDVCWQAIGDAGFPDRVRWIKAAAESRPGMDLTRVGIYGGSAGGQNAMRALIAHHDFYHVAVADCGCHDNRMDKIWWNEQWMGYPIGEHYSESSNVDQAHRTKGKLMLIVGELDRNVDPASTMQVVDALIKADKDFDLVVIPGVGHGAAGSPYGKRRQRDFFVRHLLGVEPRHCVIGLAEAFDNQEGRKKSDAETHL